MIEIDTKLKPLFRDLSALNIGQYLISVEFDRCYIKHNLEFLWNYVRKEYKYKIPGITISDTAELDTEHTFKFFLSAMVTSTKFENVVYVIIEGFINALKTKKDFSGVFEDLELINFNPKLLADLKAIYEKKQQQIMVNEPAKITESMSSKSKNVSPELTIKKKEWIKLVYHAKTKEILEQITDYATEKQDKNLIKKITLHANRWNHNENIFKAGTITQEVRGTEANKLNEVLIDLIMDLTT